ncbi:MAG: thioesterase [Acidimicrobiales bacterium]|nr:thioesterase [Acidimicrobiales bacterium]
MTADLSSEQGADDVLDIEPPQQGRVHAHRRRIQFADVSPAGRLRFDGVARMLQDISDEDTTDAGFPDDDVWVVRRVELVVHRFPVVRETVRVSTWGSGLGSRWAERRIRIEEAIDDGDPAGGRGGWIDAAALWVHLDADGRPAKLPDRFHEVYGEVIGGRKVRARLHHDARPDGADAEPFPLRATDFDLMGHVNNSVSWIPVEEALLARPQLRAPLRVSMEHPAPIDLGTTPEVTVADCDGGFDLWIVVDGQTCSSARVRPVPERAA